MSTLPEHTIDADARESSIDWGVQVAARARYLAVLAADAAGSHRGGRVRVQSSHIATAYRAILQDLASVVNAVVLPGDRTALSTRLLTAQASLVAPPAGSLRTLDAIERQVILERMQQFDGNRAAVAASCNIGLRTLYNKLQRYKDEDAQSSPAGK